MFRRSNNSIGGKSVSASSNGSGSRAFADQVARQYEVPRAMTKERVKELATIGEYRTNQLIRWVTDDDQGVAGSVAASAILRQQKENFTVYEMHDDHDDLLVMKGVVRLQNTTCDEVLALLSGRTAVEVDAFLQDLLGAQYAAGQALHYTEVSTDAGNAPEPLLEPNTPRTLQTPRGSKPITSSLMVQWMALNDVHPQAPLREFFFMRFNQSFSNTNGGSVSYGVSVLESLDLPRCGPIFSQTHMQRQPLHKCGFVVEASEEKSANITRVSFFISAPYRAHVLEQDRAWLLRLAGCVRLVPSALVNRRIRRNQLRDRRSWHFRDTCSVCSGEFSMFTRRAHHCRICGSSVCSKCSAIRKDVQRSKFSGSTRVCMACLNGDQNGLNGSASTYDSRSDVSRSSASDGESSSRDSDGECFGSSAHVTLEEALAGCTVEPTLASALPGSPSSTSSSGFSQGGEDDGDVYTNSPFDYELTFTKGNPWPDAPMTPTEKERVKVIQRLNLSQDFANTVLRDLLDLACTTVNCPVAALTVVTKSTSLFVTTIGLVGDQVPRDVGVDAHALMSHEPVVILDCRKDIRFAKNPLALSMHVQFLLGVPIFLKDSGVIVGAICVADTKARKKVKGSDLRALQLIASRIIDKMDAQNNEATEKTTDGVRLL